MTHKINGKRVSYEKFYSYKEDGLYEECWNNGKLCYKVPVINGQQHGLCEGYYNDGKLSCRVSYVNGQHHGLYESYYEDGKLEYKTYYVNGEERDDLLGDDKKLERLVIFGKEALKE